MKVQFEIETITPEGEIEAHYFDALMNFRPFFGDQVFLTDFIDLEDAIEEYVREYIQSTCIFVVTELRIQRSLSGKVFLSCFLEALNEIEDEDDLLRNLAVNN
jgi:hypothetical protein